MAKLLTLLLVVVNGPASAQGQIKPDLNGARQDFLLLCADCHGRDARGNGPASEHLSKIPPDLTAISKRAGGKFDNKKVYDWILGLNMPGAHGNREMPIWGDWLLDEAVEDSTSLEDADAAAKHVEQQVMAIVHYLKTIQAP
jgi:mono/diheme cytochrome c family protein